jgi:lysozyme
VSEETPRSKKKAVAVLAAIAIAAPAEGLRQKAYLDPVGIPTVCFGSTKGVKLGDQKTTEECKTLLTVEMREVVDNVDRCVPGAPAPVLAAFSDAAFNLGTKIACDTKNSTAARKLAAKDWEGACKELPKWDKAVVLGVLMPLPGLTKRRLEEMKLCLDYPQYKQP